MSDNQTCSSFGPAIHNTFVVGINLVGATVKNSPKTIEKILENKTIQKQLATEFKKLGEELMKQQTEGKPPQVSKAFGQLGKNAGGILQKEAVKEVKKTVNYKKLEASLQQTKCAFENSPVGVFVDKNKTLLIIVGSVAAIGGGVAMYRAKAGDAVTSILPSSFKKTIGSIDLSAKDLKFKPSERLVGGTLGVGGKWEAVKANFDIGATFANEQLKKVTGSGNLILTIGSNWQGTAKGTYNWSKEDGETQRNITGAASIGYKTRFSGNSNLNVSLFGNFADSTESGRSNELGLKSTLPLMRHWDAIRD